MARIEATTPGVDAILAEIIAMVGSRGGFLHDRLVVVEHEGDMHLECDETDGVLLAAIPRATLFAPHTEVPVSVDQQRLNDLHVALYDATGKLDWYRSAHPRATFVQHPRIVAAVQSLRPDWTTDDTLSGFLSTRLLKIAADDDRRCLMPVIDAMNHHSGSPGYRVDETALTLAVSRPNGSAEVFVRYQRHPDALDLALNYGFVDASARVVDSVPVQVAVPGVGTVAVIGDARAEGTAGDFPIVSAEPGILRLTHLRIDVDRPSVAREALRLPVRVAAARSGLPEEASAAAADRAWAAVIDANIEALSLLAKSMDATPGPATETVAHAARHQVELLRALG